MKTLVERFQESRKDLETQIRGRELAEVVRRVRAALDRIQRGWLDELLEPQSRIAIPLLHVLRESLTLPEGVQVAVPDDQTPAGVVAAGPAFLRGLGRVLVSGLLAVATIAALVEISKSTWWAWIPLGTFAAYVIVELWAAVDRGRRSAAREAASRALRAERGGARRALEPEAYLESVARLLALVDQATPDEEATRRQRAEDPDTPPAPPRALLEFLQDLLEDRRYDDAEVALKRVKSLPALLRRLGIDAVDYDPAKFPKDGDAAPLCFEFEPALDEGEEGTMTLAPALVRGEEVLLRGRVREARDDTGTA